MRIIVAALVCCVCMCRVSAEIKSEIVEYKDGDVTLEGFVAWDSAGSAKLVPGVLVVHQWMGLTDYEKNRCKQLAERGYVAFALDIYGKGIRPGNPQDAGKQAGVYKNDLLRCRTFLYAASGRQRQFARRCLQ